MRIEISPSNTLHGTLILPLTQGDDVADASLTGVPSALKAQIANALSDGDRTLCYLVYGDFGEYEGDKGISGKRWVEYDELLDNIDSAHLERELEKYRKKEKKLAAAAKAKREREASEAGE